MIAFYGLGKFINGHRLVVYKIDQLMIYTMSKYKAFYRIAYIGKATYILTVPVKRNLILVHQMPEKSSLTWIRSVNIMQANTCCVLGVNRGVLLIEILAYSIHRRGITSVRC